MVLFCSWKIFSSYFFMEKFFYEKVDKVIGVTKVTDIIEKINSLNWLGLGILQVDKTKDG